MDEGAIRLAIIGVGKIACDQHVPAIRANPAFDLVATVTIGEGLSGVPTYPTIEELAQAGVAINAVAICTPPQVRTPLALAAIRHGWHVLLEKPPAATLAAADAIHAAAAARGVSAYASWHSRHAPLVAAARTWLSERTVTRGTIVWRENARQWHPGQTWLWEPGGMGVFDPGINALSILTEILPAAVTVAEARFAVPENAYAPIAAELTLLAGDHAPIAVDFDFRQTGEQTWTIEIATADGSVLLLSDGGARLAIDGVPAPHAVEAEYGAVYRRFETLIRAGDSDVDVAPFRLVADAFLLARSTRVARFDP